MSILALTLKLIISLGNIALIALSSILMILAAGFLGGDVLEVVLTRDEHIPPNLTRFNIRNDTGLALRNTLRVFDGMLTPMPQMLMVSGVFLCLVAILGLLALPILNVKTHFLKVFLFLTAVMCAIFIAIGVCFLRPNSYTVHKFRVRALDYQRSHYHVNETKGFSAGMNIIHFQLSEELGTDNSIHSIYVVGPTMKLAKCCGVTGPGGFEQVPASCCKLDILTGDDDLAQFECINHNATASSYYEEGCLDKFITEMQSKNMRGGYICTLLLLVGEFLMGGMVLILTNNPRH